MRTTRITRRTAVVSAFSAFSVFSALVLAGAATVPAVAASAGSQSAAPAASVGSVVRSGSRQSATDRVADFYGAYIDAVSARSAGLRDALRSAYLTAGLRERLTAWEAAEHTDGVLRAQDVPVSWSVSTDGAGAGHVFTTVTLVRGTGRHPVTTRLAVQSDLSTRRISDIKAG